MKRLKTDAAVVAIALLGADAAGPDSNGSPTSGHRRRLRPRVQDCSRLSCDSAGLPPDEMAKS